MKTEAANPSGTKGRRPKVSVVMPVLNGERHLRPAIESILAQDFGDFEFLVIDDGSTDGTADILRRFAKRDRRIKVFGRDHQGIVSALNFGLGEAQGEFLARMDADDVARPDRFGKQVATLSADPSTGVLGSYVECIDTDGLPIRVFEAPLTHGELDRLHMAEGGPRLWHPAVMMRTEILRRIGGYSADYPYTEDYDLWLRMGEVSRLATYPEPLLQYRLHLQSASVTKRGIQQDSASRALSAARARRGLPDAPVAASRKAPTELDVIRKWAWWALDAGNLSTARVYALKSLRLAPFSTASLKLCTSVLRAGR